MDPSQYTDGPGQIEAANGIPCFNPDSLPPTFDLTHEIASALEEASYALGQLSALYDNITNENQLLAPFVVREAAMSSQIEGTTVTVSDIILHETADGPAKPASTSERDIQEAYNYGEAIKSGIGHLNSGGSIDHDLLCTLHNHLLVDVPGEDKRPGEVRDVPVMLGSSNDPEDAQFIPAHPAHVSILLDQLLSYIQMGHLPTLIDIAIVHYQFETIHPFRDGNGRLGRLLLLLQLYEAGLLSEPYLYLSAYFNRNRSEYFDKLLAISQNGAWEEWIVFVLEAIKNQAKDAYDCGLQLTELRREYLQRYEGRPAMQDFIAYLFQEPYLTASRAQTATGRSKRSIYNAIDTLSENGIIEEITGKQRGRIYRAPEILSLIEPH